MGLCHQYTVKIKVSLDLQFTGPDDYLSISCREFTVSEY